jgi:hypothetical protein
LENTYPNNWTSVKENLRKALAQPKREWVGLTDEEINDLIVNKVTDADMIREALRKAQEK